jgi:glycosyltransferase involved in cell wall biosynthesis
VVRWGINDRLVFGDALKILQVIPYFYPAWRFGGPVRVAYDISRKLVERGHSVVVYTSDIREKNTRMGTVYSKIGGVDVFYFKNLCLSAAKRNLFVTPSLMPAVKNNAKFFDVVHIHGNRTTQSPVLHHFLKKSSVPYVVQAHGGLPIIGGHRLKQLYDLFFGHELLKDASKVIALTRTEVQKYRCMGVPKEKIEVIPNGIDLSEYADLPPKGCFKKKFGIDESKKTILYLGRINRIKGIDFLIRAYASLIKDMNCNNALLVIAGPDDGYLNEAKSLASSLGVSNSVLFTGSMYGRDKIEAYIDSDVYVLPSIYETFPMTVLEAYACGKPVIASKVGGLSDLVMNEETGMLVDLGNTEQLAKNILYLLNNAGKAKEMGLKGKEFIKDNFAIEKVVDRLQCLYRDVALSPPSEFAETTTHVLKECSA